MKKGLDARSHSADRPWPARTEILAENFAFLEFSSVNGNVGMVQNRMIRTKMDRYRPEWTRIDLGG